MKGWKPTRQQVAEAFGKSIPDVLGPGLKVCFVGVNPSLYSAAVGHHFARPGNRFWPALYDGGFTDQLLSAFEDRLLPQYGCGITNVASRATAKAEELSVEELRKGGKELERKIRKFRPQCVAFLGITAYRAAWDRPRAKMGRQKETLGEADLWVLPNPSGLNAHFQRPDFARLFAALRQCVMDK